MTASHEPRSTSSPPASRGGPLRVLLVDDHALWRRGLRALLETHGLEVVGEAADGRDGVRLGAELAYDVVVMDLSMPVMNGIEATRALMAHKPATRIVVITVSSDEPDVLEALLAGACGYILKDAPAEQVVAAIRAAAVGESFISPTVAGRLVRQLRANRDSAAPVEDGLEQHLTQRELEVLGLLAQGYENQKIATALFLSPATVKRHVSSILEKLHVHSRIHAAIYAVRHQLDRDPESVRAREGGVR